MAAVPLVIAQPVSSMAQAAATLDEHTGPVVIAALYAGLVGHLFILPLARRTVGPEQERQLTSDLRVPGPLGVVERILYLFALLADAGLFIPLWIAIKVVGSQAGPSGRQGVQRTMLLNAVSVLFAGSGWVIATRGGDGWSWALALAVVGPPALAIALALWIDVRRWNEGRGAVRYGDTRDYVSAWLESPLGSRRRAWLHRPAEWLGWARRRDVAEPPPDAPGATDGT